MTICESINQLKEYVDYQLECHEAVIIRLKNNQDFHTEDSYNREWNGTVRRLDLLWEIKIQVDELAKEKE